MEGFKRCWACGSEAHVEIHKKMSGVSTTVHCSNDDCYVRWLDLSEKDWNRRAMSDEVKELVKACEEISGYDPDWVPMMDVLDKIKKSFG